MQINSVRDMLEKRAVGRSVALKTFKIHEKWYKKLDEAIQREIIKKITQILASENIAKDIAGYPKAPPSFRIWGGGTVEPENIRRLLPWIEWAYSEIKLQQNILYKKTKVA